MNNDVNLRCVASIYITDVGIIKVEKKRKNRDGRRRRPVEVETSPIALLHRDQDTWTRRIVKASEVCRWNHEGDCFICKPS